jgi:hypothetical protein
MCVLHGIGRCALEKRPLLGVMVLAVAIVTGPEPTVNSLLDGPSKAVTTVLVDRLEHEKDGSKLEYRGADETC